MHNIGVIGKREEVLKFKAIGFKSFAAENFSQAKEALIKCINDDFAIIYVSETFALELMQIMDMYSEQVLPAIIPIPGMGENKHIGSKNIDKAVERAVGSNIL